MSIESELKDIKKYLIEISRKLDEIINKSDTISLMKLSQESLKFLEDELDIYSIKDIKKRYK